jgi:lipopolysaccharide/colanic/teichoic acid biosynthesis glycosyltransferase
VYDRVKRAVDITGAAILLVVTAPVLLVAAVAIAVTMGSPIVFRQARAGRGGRVFTVWKLRTMHMVRAGESALGSEPARLTDVGRWLRATSVDELPQLWNVLRGEMSLVGPRPLLPEYVGRYSTRQARRHEVLPGLTGLVQVSGRNALGWKEKLDLDVWYVDHRSLRLDAAILLRSVAAVAARRGAGPEGAPEFRG